MEEHQKLIQEANRFLLTADHLAYTTYPLVKENKMLLAIVQNLNSALTHAMEAILQYDRLYKRIPPLPSNFDLKLDMFKTKCLTRYSLPRESIQLIRDLKLLIREHEKSPIEFSRKDKFVICSEEYRMRTLNIHKVKDYIVKSKPFIEKATRVLSRK